MNTLLIVGLVAFVNADVSHLLNHQYSNYQYTNAVPENSPHSSYGAPQASVLGNAAHSVSVSNSGSGLFLPHLSGPSVTFNSGLSTPSSVTIDYNGFSSPIPSAGLSSFQVSTPAPNVDLSNIQVSTPVPNLAVSSFQGSTPAPSVDLSGFQVSTPSSVPSVNLVQYSQPSSSYQFLSKLSQPTVSVPSFGFSQIGSDASINSGFNIPSAGLGVGSSLISKTSGGSLNDAFGVVTDAAANSDVIQQPEVNKHLYFFAAPEEEEVEEVHAKIELPPTPPKKSYKVIFIKAPTYRNQATITVPAPPQNEEKTLVYVLVKKPETQPKVKFQDAAPTQPSKPEVFFIKYKTQKEAEAAVAEIQNKHGAAGHVIANLPAGTQTLGGVSVSSTPSPVSFGGSEISAFGADTAASPGSLSGLSFVSSSPAPITFDSNIYSGNLNGLSIDSLKTNGFVSSTPIPIGFDNKITSGGFSGLSLDSLGANSFVSSTPASINLNSNINSGNFDGLSFDSLGANSFVSSTPSSVNFESRISGDETHEPQNPIISQLPTHINSEQSSQVAGANQASRSDNGVVASAEVEASVGSSDAQQQESNSSLAPEGEAVSNVLANASASERPESSNISENVIEQRIAAGDSEGAHAAVFSSYGPPKN